MIKEGWYKNKDIFDPVFGTDGSKKKNGLLNEHEIYC